MLMMLKERALALRLMYRTRRTEKKHPRNRTYRTEKNQRKSKKKEPKRPRGAIHKTHVPIVVNLEDIACHTLVVARSLLPVRYYTPEMRRCACI